MKHKVVFALQCISMEIFHSRVCTDLVFDSVPQCIQLHTRIDTTCPCPRLDRHSRMSTPSANSHLRLLKEKRKRFWSFRLHTSTKTIMQVTKAGSSFFFCKINPARDFAFTVYRTILKNISLKMHIDRCSAGRRQNHR